MAPAIGKTPYNEYRHLLNGSKKIQLQLKIETTDLGALSIEVKLPQIPLHYRK